MARMAGHDVRNRGRNCELLRVELADGECVIAEVGKLVYLRGAVEWNVVLPGRGFAGKVAAGIRRKIGGVSGFRRQGIFRRSECRSTVLAGFAETGVSAAVRARVVAASPDHTNPKRRPTPEAHSE